MDQSLAALPSLQLPASLHCLNTPLGPLSILSLPFLAFFHRTSVFLLSVSSHLFFFLCFYHRLSITIAVNYILLSLKSYFDWQGGINIYMDPF